MTTGAGTPWWRSTARRSSAWTGPISLTSSPSVIFVTPSDPAGPVLTGTDSPSVSPSVSPSATPSVSPDPSSNSPTECGNGGDTLAIIVKTDLYSWGNSWIPELRDETTREWTVVRSNDLPDSYTRYEDYPCLEDGRLYRWTLRDTYGDGFVCGYNGCGYYHLWFKGELIVTTGTFTHEVVREIGPVDCVDEGPEQHLIDYNGVPTRATCSAIARQIERQDRPDQAGVHGCGLPLTDGSGKVADKCKETCASYGVGPCAPDPAAAAP